VEKIVVGVDGMSCQGCVKNLTGALQALPGVQSVSVSLEDAQASIVYDSGKTSPADFKTAIEAAGFDAR